MASIRFYNDSDPVETEEWLDAFASLVEREGADRARFILQTLSSQAQRFGVSLSRL